MVNVSRFPEIIGERIGHYSPKPDCSDPVGDHTSRLAYIGNGKMEVQMKASIRLTVFMLALGWFVVCAAATPPAAQGADLKRSTSTPAPATMPAAGLKVTRGVFIVTGHNVAIQAATYTNPAVDGIAIRTFWSEVQPAPEQFNWSFIDSQVQAASASGKQVILIVLPGVFTPAWALQGAQSAQFVVDYGFVQGKTMTLPLPWDTTYLNRWFAFVRVLGQRYDSNPAVVNVPATGPTSPARR